MVAVDGILEDKLPVFEVALSASGELENIARGENEYAGGAGG